MYHTVVYTLYSPCTSQFNDTVFFSLILVTIVKHNFPAKVVSMATEIMWPVNYIIADQNTKYCEYWGWIAKTSHSLLYSVIFSAKTDCEPFD